MGKKSAVCWRAVAVCVSGWHAAAVCYFLLRTMEDHSRSPPPPTSTEAAPLTEPAVRALIREEVAAAVAAALALPSTSRPPSSPATGELQG